MAARTILTVRDGQNIPLYYSLRNSALSTYFSTAQVTAVTGVVVDKSDNVVATGLVLTYAANRNGYLLDWNPGSLLDGLNWALVRLTPTRVGVPAALTPTREIELDLSDVLQRQDEIEAKIDTADAAIDFLQADFDAFQVVYATAELSNQAEHDATQASIAAMAATNQTEHDTTQAAITAAAATNQAEHDATQALLQAIQLQVAAPAVIAVRNVVTRVGVSQQTNPVNVQNVIQPVEATEQTTEVDVAAVTNPVSVKECS